MIFDILKDGSGQVSSPKCPGVLEPQVQITVTYWLPGVVTVGHTVRWMVSQAEGESSKEGGKHCPEHSCQRPLVGGVKSNGFNCLWQG